MTRTLTSPRTAAPTPASRWRHAGRPADVAARARVARVVAGALCACAALAALWATPAAAETAHPLPALNSYGQPPFTPATPGGAGLAARFLAQLNEELADGPAFHLEPQPRRRLELTLETPGFRGLALFLAPEFLPAGLARPGDAWSAPVMVDENLLVSARPLAVPTLDALDGLRLGAIAGHVHRLLEPRIEASKLAREDAPDHVANLRKLCLDRVDVVVISRSELAGTTPLAECARAFHFTPFPQPQVILRRVLVRLPAAPARQTVVEAVARVACSERWRSALATYGLSTVGCGSAAPRRADGRG